MRSVTSLKPIVSPIAILVRIRRIFFSTRRTGAVRSLSLCKLSGVILCTLFGVLFEYGPTGGAYGRGQETRP